MPGAIGLNNGLIVSTSATLPSTFDGSGYNAITPTAIGEVIDTGELTKAFEVVAHQAVGTAYPKKFKGTYDVPDMTLSIARDWDDAGQVIVMAALASSNSYTFKFAFPDGETGWITGKVSKAGFGSAATNGMRSLSVTIAVDPQSLVLVAA
jgi:hypothetical protein